MSRTTSPGTGRVYGVERVCAIWDVPRSSFYAEQQRKVSEPTRPTARRRGPKPKISDEDLLAAILADLEASLFEGEGYRKVWARLRVQQGIRVEELKKTSHVHSRRPQGACWSRLPSRSDGELLQSRPSAYR